MCSNKKSCLLAMTTQTLCRCPKLPHSSLRSSANVFTHTPICNVAGDTIVSLTGPNYRSADDSQHRGHQRRLFSVSDNDDTPVAIPASNKASRSFDAQLPGEANIRQSHSNATDFSGDVSVAGNFEIGEAGSLRNLQSDLMFTESSDNTGMRKLTAVPEFGPERDRSHWDKAQFLRDSMRKNLRETGWLAGFDPMQMHCPLLGRRVEWQAVSEFAALAWRCDGLGFSWECLHAGT
jgi:hypothetical protein